MDALVYGVAASLGFAVIENWEYVLGASKDGLEVAKDVALIRSFTAVPLNALAGVIEKLADVFRGEALFLAWWAGESFTTSPINTPSASPSPKDLASSGVRFWIMMPK